MVNLHHDVNYPSNDIAEEHTKDDIFWNDNTENKDEEKSQNAIFQRKGSLITHRKNKISSAGSKQCGPINLEAVQQVLAAKWAIDVINNQSLPHEIKIGKLLFRLICLRYWFNQNRTILRKEEIAKKFACQ